MTVKPPAETGMAIGTIDTPALVIDLDALERNLRRMADFAAAAGIAVRPHAKTHKTAEIARLQLGLGAVGLTVATIGEAEKFADAGVTDLFIAYPLWPSPQRLARLAHAGVADGKNTVIGLEHGSLRRIEHVTVKRPEQRPQQT